MTPQTLDQAAIVTALKGQSLHIPSLVPFFRDWPLAKQNPFYPSLTPIVTATIRRIAAAQPPVERRLKDDIALLTSLWYPTANQPQLEAFALFAVWLVCWDDEVDANEGDLAGDLTAADEWRAETLAVVEAALNLPDAGDLGDVGDVGALNGTMVAFGERIAQTSLALRRRVLDEATFFIRCCAVEQRVRLEGAVPDYETYMAFRLGTIGSGLLCALVEYATGQALPPTVAQSAAVKVLERQVGVLLSLLNDMLSLKKELGTGCVINAVATLLSPGKSLGDVVDELCETMRDAVSKFDAAAASLLEDVEDEDARGAVETHIDGYRAIVTGTLEFTLRSPRYNISKLLREDGSLQIVL